MGLGKTVKRSLLSRLFPERRWWFVPRRWSGIGSAKRSIFCQGFRCSPLDGPDREKRFSAISSHRLVITSYALLRRDIEHYKIKTLSAVVLDEAQHIKNPESQNAKAAGALSTSSRFILRDARRKFAPRPGPFQFILPGYLGSRQDFKERYETPLLNGARSRLATPLASPCSLPAPKT